MKVLQGIKLRVIIKGAASSTNTTFEEQQYFFHPDHLGSSNYLTDVLGEAYQHVEFLPFGETFLEERNTQSERNPYLYNGKEKDMLTGLYYYGARYYDPNKSIFLGVDPLAEKYPNISSFAYCANNPIMLIDPDGREFTGNDITISKPASVSDIATQTLDDLGLNLKSIDSSSPESLQETSEHNVQQIKTQERNTETVKEITLETADLLETTGSVMTTAGIVAELPSSGTSTGLVGAGLFIQGTGAALRIGVEISEGNYSSIPQEVVKLGISFVGKGITRLATTRVGKKVLDFTFLGFGEASDTTFEYSKKD